MDDNERPHRAHLVDNHLESEDIYRMDWLAKFPDLNPIEHAWDALWRATAICCQPPPRTIQELKIALLEKWVQHPQGLLNSLINSMATCCAFYLSVRGDHTPY
ncbi:Transposable element Tc3 transposase, partial [Stegodyphus mimosarum]